MNILPVQSFLIKWKRCWLGFPILQILINFASYLINSISLRPFVFRSWLRQFALLPLLGLIKCYQYCLSPFIPKSCRFLPTCSEYALEALRKHGPIKGLYLTVRRILRCNPWGGHGYDPVPP